MKFESLHKIISNARHLRYLYFIDESYYGDKLLQLFNKNLNIWGGRYNPIVPIINNILPTNWEKLIEYYDPDYIGFSSNIPVDYIENICEKYEFNPISIFGLDDSKNCIEGVYSAN